MIRQSRVHNFATCASASAGIKAGGDSIDVWFERRADKPFLVDTDIAVP